MTIRLQQNTVEKQKMIKQYEEGYRNKPESVDEITALEKLSADAFKEEHHRPCDKVQKSGQD